MNKPLNIIVPVYNEGKNILNTLNEIKTKIKTPHQIFIIYDFEEDDTLPVVRNIISQNNHIHLKKNHYGRGALNAIRSGFNEAKDGAVLVIMADLSDDLGVVDEMYQKTLEGYEIVCGSRYMKGGKQIGGPWFKKFLSRTAGISLYYLAKIPTHDVTNSFKMYTNSVLKKVTIESTGGFELGMEIVIKAHFKGFKITEVPSIWKDRVSGASRFRLWHWLPKYLYWYFLALRYSFTANSLKG